MTTVAPAGREVRVDGVRAVRRGPDRVKVLHGRARLRWWHGRLALGATIGGAMLGALAAVVQALVQQGAEPLALLEAYGAGAGLGAATGLVLGLLLSLVLGVAERYVLPQVVQRRRRWVRYRRG